MIGNLSATDLVTSDPTGGDRSAALQEASRAFEGYLLGAMLRFGARPLDPDDPLTGGPAQRMYRELFFDEIAKLAAARGGFGVAQLVSRVAGAQTEEGS